MRVVYMYMYTLIMSKLLLFCLLSLIYREYVKKALVYLAVGKSSETVHYHKVSTVMAAML